jgi:hypothetical protein
MSQQLEPYPLRGTQAEEVDTFVKFVGGTNAVTKVYGPNVTVTYISAGIVDLTWATGANNPGTCLGVKGHCFQATTPGDVKAYELVPGVYNTTTCTLRLNMYETGTLTNLDALEWLGVTVAFTTADV